ncbi:MAG: STAS domain-containing protein [Microthrixaceae bacterium]
MTDAPSAPGAAPGSFRVELLGIPVALHERTREHHDALQRELDVMCAGSPADSVPARLVAMMAELADRYRSLNPHVLAELRLAAERGDEHLDLRVEVPDQAAAAVERLANLLAEADEFCRSGELVTLVTPPEVAAYREWFLGEFSRQHAGLAPTRWIGPPASIDAEPPAQSLRPAGPSPGSGESVAVRPTGAVDLVSAGQLRDELLAARSGGAAVVLDLLAVDFIDSVGMSLIVSAQRRLQADGTPLQVLVPDRLRSSFELTGLDQVLDITYS